jgi:hypothetical protein
MSEFFELNLQALATKPVHKPVINALNSFIPPLTPSFEVMETEAGDLTLVRNGIPIHAVTGAIAEASALVTAELQSRRYAQNIVFGLGLGYLLRATVKAKQADAIVSKVLVYEPDLELLHFIVSNVNLADYLSHPDVTLHHLPLTLFQTLNSRYIQGDGLGLMLLPGQAAAYPTETQSIVERLERNTDNAARNTDLLKLRAKDWSKHFLNNASLLPQGLPVDELKGLFAGQTVVLVGSGPSLGDQLEELRAVRDHVVIMAVGGAVKTLVNAGITPHIALFMDFYGPKQQLHGLHEPLKNSHIISGPSAERVGVGQPCLSRWWVSMFFNEQFSWCLDAAFDRTLARFHTGGTVSMLGFHIAFELGFSRFILLGQDLALRGTQMYADGTQIEIGDDDILRLPETETTNAKSIALQTVRGWEEGTLLKSPTDYAYYILNFQNVVQLTLDERPEAELYNTSVGGAFIEGYTHCPLAELVPLLTSLPTTTIDEPLQALAKAKLTPEASLAIAQRHTETLSYLLGLAQTSLALVQQAKPKLQALLNSPPSQWFSLSQAYSEVFNQLAEQLESTPFYEYTLFHEQLTLYQNHRDNATTNDDHRHNFNLDALYMAELDKAIGQGLIPQLTQAIKELVATYNLPTPAVLLGQGKALPPLVSLSQPVQPAPKA